MLVVANQQPIDVIRLVTLQMLSGLLLYEKLVYFVSIIKITHRYEPMRLNGLDLNQLICLDALLSEQNVSRVANKLHLSQSAVSWILARLRQHFGDQLLIPESRRMVSTAFADELREQLRELILMAQAFERRRPTSEPREFDRTIRLVASDATQSICVSQAIREAAKHAPNLRFDLLPVTESSHTDLRRGEIDLLCASQSMEVGTPGDALFEDRFCCISWNVSEIFSTPLTPERYLSLDHVMVKWGSLRATTEEAMALINERPRRRDCVTAPYFASIPELLIGTDRIATVPTLLALNMAGHWPIATEQCPIEFEPIRVSAYWRNTLENDPALLWFRKILCDTAQKISS